MSPTGNPGLPAEAGSPFFLSERQTQTLTLAARGLTEVAIAGQLGIRQITVKKHLSRARANLGAINTTHAVAIAVASNLINF